MAIRTLLKFRNLDLTTDINDRYTKLIEPGCFYGGEVIPVAAQLKVDLLPWKAVSVDGMVVEETSATSRFDTPAGQTTVIAVKMVYNQNNDPLISIISLEESAYNSLPDLPKYVIFSKVVVPIGATQVLTSYIDKKDRDIIDTIGRNRFRGVLSSSSSLPLIGNQLGDIYEIVDGLGGLPHLYSWNNFTWNIMTASAQIAVELNTHRQNLYPNEKHLTDARLAAMDGTSGTALSGTNKVVDNADLRIPTQDENNALVGSDGSPSSSNKYITQEFKLAIPEEKVYASPSQVITALATDGPYYVGKSGAGTANNYFSIYNSTLKREYVTVSGVALSILGVYTDAGATSELTPSINPNVDSDGFFNTFPLYIKLSVVPDSDIRLVYGKKQLLKNFPANALLRRSAVDAQTSTDAIKTVENIKGRLWDDTPPTVETNIELRKQLLSTKEYLSSVFNSDYVFWDFNKLKNISEYNSAFQPNVGINHDFKYLNTALVPFTYDGLGKVTYATVVPLTSLGVGSIFIDGKDDEFIVISTNGITEINITNRNGYAPRTINTTLSGFAGSIKVDDNPRRINLSDFFVTSEKEKIAIREIEPILNEFHPSGNVAYSIKSPTRSPFYTNTRVRLYGGFENIDAGGLSRVVANGACRLSITGFFTDLYLLADIGLNSPIVSVFVDNSITSSTVDLSRSNTVSNIGDELDFQQQKYNIASGLNPVYPHTVEMVVDDALDDFRLFGFELYNAPSSSISISPGRAYVQTDIVKNDAFFSYINSGTENYRRGAAHKIYIDRSKNLTSSFIQMVDVDGVIGVPNGVAVSGTPNFGVASSGLAKFTAFYNAGAIVRLVTATAEQTLRILSIGPTPQDVVFTSNVTVSGPAIMLLVASESNDTFDPTKEYKRYSIREFGVGHSPDFSALFFSPSDKVYTAEDGITSLCGNQIQYATTSLSGADVALTFPYASSQITLRTVACAVDMLIANSSTISADISIDGSPFDAKTISGSGFRKVTLFLNARYQTHEVRIKNAVGLDVVGFIMNEPSFEPSLEGTYLAHRNVLAKYSPSLTTDSTLTAIGGVSYDPFIYGGVYINGTSGTGTPWAYSLDFLNSPDFGRYSATSFPGSYFEYSFCGTGLQVEYTAGENRGIPIVIIDGILATSINFPTVAFYGLNAINGEVDMYAAAPAISRKKFSIAGLATGMHIIKLEVQNPRKKNPSSIDYYVNVISVTEINTSGSLAITPQFGYKKSDFAMGSSSFRDERNFDSGAIAQNDVITTRLITTPARTAKIALANGAVSHTVVFSTPMTSDYTVAPTFVNNVDAYPLFQPFIISNQTYNGFTVSWNMPLDSVNYLLTYTVIAIL